MNVSAQQLVAIIGELSVEVRVLRAENERLTGLAEAMRERILQLEVAAPDEVPGDRAQR